MQILRPMEGVSHTVELNRTLRVLDLKRKRLKVNKEKVEKFAPNNFNVPLHGAAYLGTVWAISVTFLIVTVIRHRENFKMLKFRLLSLVFRGCPRLRFPRPEFPDGRPFYL